MAWPGDPAEPGIRFAVDETSRLMSISSAPQQVRILPGQGHRVIVMWLEPILPDELHLVNVVLGDHYDIERTQSTISNRPTHSYAAVATPDESVITLWTEAGQNLKPLYAQYVDGLGRSRPPVLVAPDADYPSAAFDANGNLHVVWLSPGVAHQWTIQYTVFPKGEPAGTQSTPIGVIDLPTDQALDDFTLGLDATSVYCLWSTSSVKDTSASAQLQGLIFPMSNNADLHPLNLSNPDQWSLRWPQVPPTTGKVLTISATGSQWNGHTWMDRPVVISLAPNGAASIQPVTTESDGQIGKTAPFIDADGWFSVAWSALRPDGSSTIYFATTRP